MFGAGSNKWFVFINQFKEVNRTNYVENEEWDLLNADISTYDNLNSWDMSAIEVYFCFVYLRVISKPILQQ